MMRATGVLSAAGVLRAAFKRKYVLWNFPSKCNSRATLEGSNSNCPARNLMIGSPLSRRTLVKYCLTAGLGGSALALWPTRNAAAAALDPNDPSAKALGFVSDSKTVDAASNPTFKPAQRCASCAQYQGKASDPQAACSIFGGKTVPAGGWCKVWVQKPS